MHESCIYKTEGKFFIFIIEFLLIICLYLNLLMIIIFLNK